MIGVIFGIIGAGVVFALVFQTAKKIGGSQKLDIEKLQKAVEERSVLLDKVRALSSELVTSDEIGEKGKILNAMRLASESESARFAILQAEIEAVEIRLRELEEIERELQAGTTDAVAELRGIEKQLGEIDAKGEVVKASLAQIQALMGGLQAELAQQPDIQSSADSVLKTAGETNVVAANLLVFLRDAAAGYHKLKLRYDALDIEYAQLFEKMQQSGK
jgi:hypothetical protein